MLATDALLTQDQMEHAAALMVKCEREAAACGDVLLEVRTAHRKVTRCALNGEFLEFLVTQYRARGLSNPRKIAKLVVLDEASNALKRAMTAALEEMRRSNAA